MDVIFSRLKNEMDIPNQTVVALGNFDGLHLGHMALIEKAFAISRQEHLNAMVYTFENHPQNIIAGRNVVPIITTNEMKQKLLRDYGIDYLYFQHFDDAIMQMKPEQFVIQVLKQNLKVKSVVVGFHYHFGYKGKGDVALLKKIASQHDMNVYIIPPVKVDNQIVSSTSIRQLIIKGDVQKASLFLGRYYSIAGQVRKGKQLGRKIGFPTINLYNTKDTIMPARGVYVTYTVVAGKRYESITNVGCNPTVEAGDIKVETHLLMFNDDLYDQQVGIQFIKKVRDEIKFQSVADLTAQIAQDVLYAKQYFPSQ